jgi:hypothetical protein
MASFKLITDSEFADFAAVLRRYGWREEDFELEEDAFDPAMAEVEACNGQVGVRCLLTAAVEVYRAGQGLTWVTDFGHDLEHGKFGQPARA